MGRVSELSAKMRAGELTIQPLSTASSQGRVERMRQQLLQEGKQSRQTVKPVAEKPTADVSGAVGSPAKGKRDTSTAAANRGKELPSPSSLGRQYQEALGRAVAAPSSPSRLLQTPQTPRSPQNVSGYSVKQGLADVFKKGANQFAQAGADTLALAEDVINAPFELFSGMELGSLRNSGEGIFNPLRGKVQEEGTALAEQSAENVRKGGKAAAALDKYGTAAVAALPQSVIAMLTGGASAAQTMGGVARTAAAELSPGIARTIQNAAGDMARNPQFWSSFSQVVGNGYEQALEDGASAPKAALYAVGNGLMNAAVEIGGGIQTLPAELQAGASGWRALVDSAVDEGKEEVIQGVIERAMQNLVYQKGNPLASLKNPDAVFNPLTATDEFAGGAVVGGILSGGQMAVNRALSRKAPIQAEEAARTNAEARRGTDTTQAQNAAEAAQTGPRDVLMEAARRGGRLDAEPDMAKELDRFLLKDIETGRAAPSPADVSKLDTTPVQAGRATTIQRPYQGTRPVQAQKSAAVVQVDPGSVRTAQNRIEGARKLAADPMSAGQGFKTILMKVLEKNFSPLTGVEVSGVSFNGKPYKVDVNKTVPGKIVSDPNLTAEKLALLDILPEVVRSGEYVGSGEYVPHGRRQKQTVRYDYFETPVEINGKRFIACFDVEVEPNANNYRTHKLIEMDLKESLPLDTGPAPAATETFHSGPAAPTQPGARLAGPAPAPSSGGSGPVEGTSSLNVDSSIAQGAENVNPSGGDGLGAADAGSLNTDYDRLQAQSSRFHPEGANAARPVDVPTQDFDGYNIPKSASTMMGAASLHDGNVQQLEQIVADGMLSFSTIHDGDAVLYANKILKEKGFDAALEQYRNDVRSNVATKGNTALGQLLMRDAAALGNADALAEIFHLYAANSTTIAQAMQAQSMLRKLPPESQLVTVQKALDTLNEKYQLDLTMDQADVKDFVEAKDQETREAVRQRIVEKATKEVPTSFRAKYDAVRYLAMLGNPRTHIRNIIGNAAFQIPAIAKNRLGAMAELGARALGADVERTKSLTGANPFGDLAKEARADWKNVKDLLDGGKLNEGKTTARDIESQVKPFQNSNSAGKFVGWLAEKNGAALEWEDNLAKHWIYSQSLAGYLKANGVKSMSEASPELLNRARNYAAQEALRNTFNDRNDVSDFVAKLGNLRNSKNKTARAASYITEGILPFKRTPTNVAVRAVEYSPVGAAASIVDLINKGVRGQATAETVTKGLDRLAAGLSGTALLVLGFLASDMITGGGDEDEDQRKFDDLTGHQTYAIETDGGFSLTLDWLAPSAIPFFMGVELAHAWQDGGVSWEDAVKTLKNMSEPMLEMSMLQGLNDVFENVAYTQQHGGSVMGAAVASAATSYLTQVFPTLFGQMERISEDKRMTTYSDENSKVPKDLQFFLGKLSQKVPFWDYQQIPYLDAWGREEDTGDPVERVFNNLINPAYVSQVTVDAVEQELQRVADTTGITSVFPDRAPRYFTVEKERKNLTAEEYQTYARKRGKLGAETLKQMMDSPGYQRLSDEKKAEAIKYVYQYADSLAKMEMSSYRPGKGTVAAGVLNSMLPPSGYILYQLNRDRDGDGKVTKMESTLTLLELPGLNDQQRGQAWSAFNDSKTAEARNPFTGTLSKEGLDPEEAQTAWDIYGRSGTKEEPYTQGRKKQDLREELDLTAAEVNRVWNLMKKAAEMG